MYKNSVTAKAIFMKKKLLPLILGLFTGFMNGFLGAGGGMIAVPALKKAGLSEKAAHQNAVAVILPLTLFSAVLYLLNGKVQFSDCLAFLPSGLLGAAVGTFLLKKIPTKWLSVLFGGFMVWAGVRMMLK